MYNLIAEVMKVAPELEQIVVRPVNRREIVEKGKAVYARLREQLEPEHNGEVIVIEVESGDYFLGKDGIEARKKARDKYPDKVFYMGRVGHRVYMRLPGFWPGSRR